VSTINPSTTDVEQQQPIFSSGSSTTIKSEPIPSNEPNLSPVAVNKPSVSNEKSVLQLMNELAKFNKVC
jgi:hypothetical protein